jgi:hypothetical protein
LRPCPFRTTGQALVPPLLRYRAHELIVIDPFEAALQVAVDHRTLTRRDDRLLDQPVQTG